MSRAKQSALARAEVIKDRPAAPEDAEQVSAVWPIAPRVPVCEAAGGTDDATAVLVRPLRRTGNDH